MKGEITASILERLSQTAEDLTDLFEVFLTAGSNISLRGIEYKLSHVKRARAADRVMRDVEARRRQHYYNLLSRLRRDGLIEEKTRKEGKLLAITEAGRKKLSYLRKRESLPRISYVASKVPTMLIVIFDIPERERRKRDWLRAVLRHLGLQMIQKSVWMGKAKLPKEFIDDLHRMKLTEYVQIFEISKTGSLAEIL